MVVVLNNPFSIKWMIDLMCAINYIQKAITLWTLSTFDLKKGYICLLHKSHKIVSEMLDYVFAT